MGAGQQIDTTFDVRSDTPPGKDPDHWSPTLKRYHQLLWDKPLPSSDRFSLDGTKPGGYLHHRSDRGEFWMTSDAIVHTYRSFSRYGMPAIVDQIGLERVDSFNSLSYTMGGMMLFPSWTGVRHWSINQARGMLSRIGDRTDLTLECIRRHYAGRQSPLSKTLAWYEDYFEMFGDLRGYAQFFLLDDLLTADGKGISFVLPFDDFSRRVATPADIAEYRDYMKASTDFLRARNGRIDAWVAKPHEVGQSD